MNNKITKSFNAALIIFIIIRASYAVLFKPLEKAPIALLFTKLYETSSLGGSIFLIFLFLCSLALLLIASKFIFEFWNRFASDIFKTRNIEFQEALSLLLISVIFIR